MLKFILGFSCGLLFSISSIVYASDSIQAILSNVSFEINQKNVAVQDEYDTLNYNGHVYVPIRFAAENLEAVIDYDGEKKRVFIKNGNLNLVDPKYQSIAVGNVIVTKGEANMTKVIGQLQMDKPTKIEKNTVQGKLSFYNDNNDKIGEAEINGSDFGRKIKNFETVGNGDFRNYSRIEIKILSVNNIKIVDDPDPNEPELLVEDILKIRLDSIDKIDVLYPGKNKSFLTLQPKDEEFNSIILKMKDIKLRKAVDQTWMYGSAYNIELYSGDKSYSYKSTLQFDDNIKYSPSELTKDLNSYLEKITD